VTLTDTGPPVALGNRNDPNHSRSVSATKRVPAEPFPTIQPCFTETTCLVFRAGAYPAQPELWPGGQAVGFSCMT